MPAHMDRRGLSGDPPGDVHVTVVAARRDPAMRSRTIAGLGTATVAVVSVVAVAVISVAGTDSPNGRSPAARPVRRQSPGAEGATRYPVTCVSVAIALHDQRFAHASFDRTIPCVRGLAATGAAGREHARRTRS